MDVVIPAKEFHREAKGTRCGLVPSNEELGEDACAINSRRVSDLLGFDLQLYRNLLDRDMSVAEILGSTQALQAVALVGESGERFPDPRPEQVVDPGSALKEA